MVGSTNHKCLIVKFFPVSCYFLPLGPKYPSHHPILEHPQPMFFPYCKGLCSHPYQIAGKIAAVCVLIFILLYRKVKYSGLNGSKHSLRFLTITNDLGFSTFGYADDTVIIVQGKIAHTVREIMQEALNVVVKWAVKEGLNISPHKTAIVPFTNRRNTEGLGPLTLCGEKFAVLDRVKYLGVILDSKLTWNQHLQKIVNKVQTTFAVVRRTQGKNGVLELIWCIGFILG